SARSDALSAPRSGHARHTPVRCPGARTYSERMNIPNQALVLVGDGRKALFLRNRGTPAHPELVVVDEVEQDDPPTRELGTDRPGRKHGTDGVSRSAIEETDQHQRAEQRFAA